MYVYKNVLVYLCKRYLVYLYERFLYICANANPFESIQTEVKVMKAKLKMRGQ